MKKVQVPKPLRTKCHFLEETPQLPLQILQHLQNRTPSRILPPPKNDLLIPKCGHKSEATANMDMGPDLYDTDASTAALQTSSSSDKSTPGSTPAAEVTPPNTICCGVPPKVIVTAAAPFPQSSNPENSSKLWYEFAQASGSPDYAHARACWKAKGAGCKLCKRHQMCFASAYTRPSADMLREILVRYPQPPDEEPDEETPLVATTAPRTWKKGWRKLFRTRRV